MKNQIIHEELVNGKTIQIIRTDYTPSNCYYGTEIVIVQKKKFLWITYYDDIKTYTTNKNNVVPLIIYQAKRFIKKLIKDGKF